MSTRCSVVIGACAGALILVATAVETAASAGKPLAFADAVQIAREETAVLQELLTDQRAEREARVAAAQHMRDALDELSHIETRLAIGDADVLDALDSSAPALPFPAQRTLGNARDAVESEDLGEARYWIAVAISEAQRAQLSR